MDLVAHALYFGTYNVIQGFGIFADGPSLRDLAKAYSVRAYHTLTLSGQCRKEQLARAITLLCDAVQDAAMAAELNFVSQATLAVAFAFVDTTFGLSIGDYEVHPGMKRLFDAQRKNEYVMKQYSEFPVSILLSTSKALHPLTLTL